MKTDVSVVFEQIARGFMPARILMAGVELGAFEALARGARSSEEVAGELKADQRGTEILLGALAGLGLLDCAEGRYSLKPGVEDWLLPGGAHCQVHILMHLRQMWDAWGRLDEAVRTGRPAAATQGSRAQSDKERTRAFIMGMRDVAAPNAEAFVARLPVADGACILDVGGGPGTYCIALARRYPNLRATILDRPETLEITRELLQASGLGERIECRPGDALADGYGEGFDLVLVSQLLHAFGPADCSAIIRNAAKALAPGGVLTVHEFALNEDRCSPPHAAIFAVNMLVNTQSGRTYTIGEIEAWMAEAGLTEILHEDMQGRSMLFLGKLPA